MRMLNLDKNILAASISNSIKGLAIVFSRVSFAFGSASILLGTILLSMLLNCFMFQIDVYPQRNKIRFEKISIEEGLIQSSVVAICQDKKGFLWFGTYDGLVRYDGYQFKVFKFNPDDSTSLSENLVRIIYEDRFGIIWVGTEGGLNRFDRLKENFKNYFANSNDPNSISNNRIRGIVEDQKGELWIATEMGVNTYDRKRDAFIKYFANPTNPNSISDNFIRTIYKDREGNLWIGTNNGLDKLDVKTQKFSHYKHNPGNSNSISENSLSSILQGKDNVLWFGTRNKGVDKLIPGSTRFVHYSYNLSNPFSLQNNSKAIIHEDRFNNIWIGTYGGGLHKYDSSIDGFINYKNNQHDPTSLSSNAVYSLLEDQSGILWIGTDFGGLSKFDLRKNQFIHYGIDPGGKDGLIANNIISFYEDRTDKGKSIWIGTLGAGFAHFDRSTEKFTFHKNDPTNKNSLSNDIVRSIIKDSYGMFWIGTHEGVNKFNPRTKTFTRYTHIVDSPGSLRYNLTKVIYEDKNRNLWIGLNGGGLELYDRENDRFIHHLPESNNPNSINDDIIWCIQEDNFGNLWLGTNSGGLNYYDVKAKKFIHFTMDDPTPTRISNNKILCMYLDNENMLWLGTAGGGLNKFDIGKKVFKCIDQNDGLASNTVHSIVEDNNNNLWIGTTNGISKLNKRNDEIINFNSQDGLQGEEFHVNSVCKSITGEIFFGGTNGFNVFSPNSIKRADFIPQIVITDFLIYNKSVPIGKNIDDRIILSKSILETKKIILSHQDEVFSIQFAALDYTAPGKNLYAYKMEGFENEWNHIGTRNYATFTKLPPGNYVFRVKGSNYNGVWNETGTSLEIVIEPPIWNTWWSRLVLVLSFVAVLVLVYRIRTNSIKKYNVELEKYVAGRTDQLESINKELEAFSYSISHDLRAPLRAIDGYAKIILEEYENKVNDEGKKLLGLIRDNSKIMGNLINDILQYSRLSRADLHPQIIDMAGLVNSVLNELLDPNSKMKFEIVIRNLLPSIGDQALIRQVWVNLLSNAIKFTSKRINPLIEIGCTENEGEKTYFVKDNGAGFYPPDADKIFNIFNKLHAREYIGSGLGLALVKKIILKHGGKTWAQGELDKGATFYFSLSKSESNQ